MPSLIRQTLAELWSDTIGDVFFRSVRPLCFSALACPLLTSQTVAYFAVQKKQRHLDGRSCEANAACSVPS